MDAWGGKSEAKHVPAGGHGGKHTFGSDRSNLWNFWSKVVGGAQQTGCTTGMVETNSPVLTAWLNGGVISNLQMKRPSDQQIANNPMRLLCSSSSGRNLGCDSKSQTPGNRMRQIVSQTDLSGSETRRLF
jgi:hypothetical protein